MIKTIFITCALLSLLLLLSCSATETTNMANTSTPAQKAASPAATTASTATLTTAGEKVGVAECDDFIAAYESCVNNKVPAAARAQFNEGLAQWRKSWHALAANPQTKASLVQACKTSLESARTSMKSYGCTF